MQQPKKKLSSLPELKNFSRQNVNKARYGKRYRQVFRSTIYILLVVAAITVLIATIWLPVLQVYGTSMTPTLESGDIVVSVKAGEFRSGDIIAFYYNNKVLIKRVIGLPGDWIDIDEDGIVTSERRGTGRAIHKRARPRRLQHSSPVPGTGGQDIRHGRPRSVSVDSRNKAIGCISEENIVGKLVFRVWPLKQFGAL